MSKDVMKIEQMEPMVPNDDGGTFNPFLQDAYHMGSNIGSNITVMFEKFSNEDQDYIILINTKTGERMKILLKE